MFSDYDVTVAWIFSLNNLLRLVMSQGQIFHDHDAWRSLRSCAHRLQSFEFPYPKI